MWIRSQDKRFLLNIDNAFVVEREFVGITSYSIYYHKEIDIDLGVYSTYKKALKVLDKIQCFINNLKYSKAMEKVMGYYIFQMPQDDEVE